jgi:hypothetical protein
MNVRLNRIRNFFSTRFSRAVSFVLFWQRGALKTTFGSYIAPMESKVAEDLDLHIRLRPLMERLCSEQIDLPLVRLGSVADGGYVLLEKDYRDSFLISGGIFNDNNFEVALANLGAKAHQVDYSIIAPPVAHPNLTFSAERLVGEKSKEHAYDVTLDELVTREFDEKNTELLLKLDIEGSEWEILESCNSLTKFNQIYLELHYLDRLANPRYAESSMRALDRLLQSFFPVFLSGNNCCGFVTIGGYVLPRVMELTLLNRSTYSPISVYKPSTNQKYQSQNYPKKAPLVLKNW